MPAPSAVRLSRPMDGSRLLRREPLQAGEVDRDEDPFRLGAEYIGRVQGAADEDLAPFHAVQLRQELEFACQGCRPAIAHRERAGHTALTGEALRHPE